MKKILLTILCFIFLTQVAGYSEVVHISLDEAVSLAIDKNLDIKSKRKKAEELKQDIKIANALKNPQFQSNFLVGRVTRGNSSQFGLALPVEVAKRGIRKKVAQINLQIAENEIRASEHELKIRVMRAYFNILYMKSVVKILQEREKMFCSIKSIADNHEQYELHTSIDILQNDMKYKKQLVLLNQAKANLLGAQFALNDVMNIEGSKVMYDTIEASLFSKDLAILNINIPQYQVIEDTAMQYSYALSIAEQNIEKRSAEVTQAKRKRIPDVTVAGGYAYQTAHQTRGAALPGAFVGAGFDIPILYSYTPDVKKAKIVLNRAEIDKASFENHLKFALKEDYNDFKYAKENIEHYKVILQESMEVLDNYKKRYEKGQVMLLNLLQVETAHQENVREYINAVQVFYDAYLNLMQNVGHDILLEEEM
ncbi:TolC family protein [bacterium]|nr:TolC family protein [bacterium]MBO5446605.1 TolC family protein [bacterium]